MSTKSIEVKLKELGSKNDTTTLESFVSDLDEEKICSLISNTICHSDAPQLLSYLYQGLSRNGSMEIKRFKVTEKVLKELQSRKLNNKQVNVIVSRLALEVEKLTPEHLVQFCDYCIDCIQHDDGEQTSWKDLLPKLLTLLVASDTVNHEGVDLNGVEYKTEVIRTLLMVKWRPSIITSLASMFIEVPMTNDQHLQVVNKLCASFEQLGPSEIPPLVHHLLQVCKDQHGVALFLRLQTYFCTRLYNRLLPNNNRDTENSADLDTAVADSIELASERETQNAEATVLFHMHQSAQFGHASIKNFMKFMKSVTNAPELVLEPFLLTVLLSLSTISIYEEQVFEIFKCTMQRVVQEEGKKLKSAWLRGVTPSNCNVELLLMKLMENSVRERNSVTEGMVNLAFLLLGATAAIGKEAVAERLWGFGTFLLVRLVKKHHAVTGTVLKLLTKRISGQAVTQYIDCLYQMSLSVPLVLSEYRSIIINLLESLTQLPGHVAENVVYAVLPIVRVFPSLRDVLIIVLRKALFSRDIGARKMSVSGFLQLLKHLDVKGMAVINSQSSNSNNSQSQLPRTILTQIDMEMGNSNSNNEAICLELLGVLRRCFMQQADVRQCLYEGLHSGVIRNPELNEHVQDMLLNHFSQFYESDADVLPPLKFSKAVVLKDISAELQEPLGHLVFAIQQVVTIDLPNGPNKLTNILESLCERIIKCSLEDFGLNETTNLLDILPESQQQQEMVRQMLGVFEALMGYTISSWKKDESVENARKLNNLFKGYNRLAEFAKNNGKAGKKANGDEGGARRKKKMDGEKRATAKGSSTVFRFPHTVLDYNVAYKMLCLVHKNSVEWCTAEAANQVKGRREFSRFVMEVILSLVKTSRSEKCIKSASSFQSYINIGSVLYSECVCKLQEFTEFDIGTAFLALECFNELIALVCSNHKDRLGQFLGDVGDVPVKEGQGKQLLEMATKYEELLTNVLAQEDESEDEPKAKKIPLLLVQGLTQLAMQIQCQESSTKVLNWVKSFAKDQVLTDSNLIKKVLSLLFTLELRCKGSSQLYDHIAMQLCDLIGIVENGEELEKYTSYNVVKAGTETTALLLLCDTVKQMLEHVEWVLARLRAEYIAMTHSVADKLAAKRELLKSKEHDVVNQVSHCVQILNYVSSLALEPGPLSDAVLKLLTHQYIVLSALTKYFILRTTKTNAAFQAAKFEMVVKLAGKYLSPHVYNLISHIEANQKKKRTKKEVDPLLMKSKVLRETRYIPKLVFEMEQFEKCVIELSKKSKVDLMNYVKLSTHRDFRIQLKHMQSADDQDHSINESASEAGNDNNDSTIGKEPPKKKARKQ
ncbi:Fanconi anemia group I protein [Periplaneta americana]|uniref:Fanconi anemia group I protein n=1 Tax=Periplaneta americana TaxID=6978 RepID=UPI0037E8D9FA